MYKSTKLGWTIGLIGVAINWFIAIGYEAGYLPVESGLGFIPGSILVIFGIFMIAK